MEKKTITFYDRNSTPVGSATHVPNSGWDWFVTGQNVSGRAPTLLDAADLVKKEIGRDVCVTLDVASEIGREARRAVG